MFATPRAQLKSTGPNTTPLSPVNYVFWWEGIVAFVTQYHAIFPKTATNVEVDKFPDLGTQRVKKVAYKETPAALGKLSPRDTQAPVHVDW